MLLHPSPHPRPHPLSSTADLPHGRSEYADAQRDRLSQFGDKFTRYSSSFGITALAQHLRFLNATYHFFTSVGGDFAEKDPATGHKSPTPVVRVLLTKALVRFETWLDKCLSIRNSNEPLAINEVPPLDVLIILHGYMLSPWTYDEDATFRFPSLHKISQFPLEHMGALVDIKSGEFTPSTRQIRAWETATSLPFDIHEYYIFPVIGCPSCGTTGEVPWTEGPVPRHGGSGFAEAPFRHECLACKFTITRDTMSTKKFVDDLIAVQDLQQPFMAGTAIGGIGDVQLQTAATIAAEVIKSVGDPKDNLGEKLSWNMNEARLRIYKDSKSRIAKTKIDDLLRPYTQPSPFSTDLIYKALLQGEFSLIMAHRGMFDPLVLEEQQTEDLENAIRAYRLFVKLVLLPHLPKVYPTDSVDLVWHTHQLQGKEYKRQIRDMVGVFVDHRSFDELAPTADIFNEARDTWRAALQAAGFQNGVTNPNFVTSGEDHEPNSIRGMAGGGSTQAPSKPKPKPPQPTVCGRSASQVLAEDSILVVQGMLEEAQQDRIKINAMPPVDQLRQLLADATFSKPNLTSKSGVSQFLPQV